MKFAVSLLHVLTLSLLYANAICRIGGLTGKSMLESGTTIAGMGEVSGTTDLSLELGKNCHVPKKLMPDNVAFS